MTLAFALVSELTGPDQVHLSQKCKWLDMRKGNYQMKREII